MNYVRQLQAILKASGWSQEDLARRLDVSFVTLNTWLNKRVEPRQQARIAIETLYYEIVGTDSVDARELTAAKKRALNHKTTLAAITSEGVLDRLILHLTYHTNTIEGSTMTLADTAAVLFEHKVLTNRTQIEQVEAQNHRAALVWLLGALADPHFAVNEELIKALHLRLMNGIMENAGQYRTHGVRIMGTRVTVANYLKISGLIQSLCKSMNGLPRDVIGSLAADHAVFEKIHPFSDGNGRIGRLLLLAQALQANLVPPIVVRERRTAYYKYLELAQMRDNPRPLALFMAESIATANRLLFEA